MTELCTQGVFDDILRLHKRWGTGGFLWEVKRFPEWWGGSDPEGLLEDMIAELRASEGAAAKREGLVLIAAAASSLAVTFDMRKLNQDGVEPE